MHLGINLARLPCCLRSGLPLVLLCCMLLPGLAVGQVKRAGGAASAYLKGLDNRIFKQVNVDPNTVHDSAWAQVGRSRAEGQLGYEAHAHYYLAWVWNWRNNLDSALHHAVASLELAVLHGDETDLSNGYNMLGIIQDLRGQPDSAAAAYERSLAWAIKAEDNRYVARAQLNLGMVYRSQGKLAKSLGYLHQAEELCLKKGFMTYLPNLYLNMGGVYQQLGDRERAMDGFHRGLRLARLNKKPRIMAANMEALGDVSLSGGDTLEALCWYEWSLKLAREAGIPGQVGQSSAKAAMVMLGLGRSGEAEEMAELGVRMAREAKDTVNLSRAEYALGRVELLAGRAGSALGHCKLAHRYAVQTRQRPAMLEICDCLWRSAEQAGQPGLALQHYREYEALRDSLYGKESSLAIARLEARLDYERQHTADSLAQVAADVQREANHRAELMAEQDRSRRTLWITIVAVVLALAALGTLAIFRRQNRRLVRQNETIQSQNAAINAALEEKEVLLREVHHRVKNNLQVMISLLDMQAQKVTDPHALEVLLASKGRVQAMTLIHQKLYQQENIAALVFGTYLKQLVEEVRALFPDGAGVELEFSLVDGEFGIDTAVPLGLILNELVTNAFKYAYQGRKGGRLRLSLRQLAAERYVLEVEDDGPGMPEEVDLKQRKTLGLQLVVGLARQLRGQVDMGRSDLGGCRTTIQFTPIKTEV